MAKADNVGFQYRIPFSVSADKNIKNSSARSFLLSFFLDQETEAGLLTESYAFSDGTSPAPATAVRAYNVNALRISKNISTSVPVYIGLDVGNLTIRSATADLGSISMGDIFGGVKLLTSKGKITSFLAVELNYRIAKSDIGSAGGSEISDFGGSSISLSVGANF